MYVFDITYLLKGSIKVAKKFRVIPSSVFYSPIRVLSPHPCFIPSSVFYPPSVIYPPIRVLSPHPCFIPSSVFYPLIRVLSPHPCFIPSSVFYPLIRVLSPHPCFIPSSVFYPLIRVLSPHPCFIPPSVFYPLIRVLSPHPCFILSSVFYPLIRVLSPHPYPYPAIRIRIRIRVLSQPFSTCPFCETSDRRKGLLAKLAPECLDLLDDKALFTQGHADLFGKKFKKNLLKDLKLFLQNPSLILPFWFINVHTQRDCIFCFIFTIKPHVIQLFTMSYYDV